MAREPAPAGVPNKLEGLKAPIGFAARRTPGAGKRSDLACSQAKLSRLSNLATRQAAVQSAWLWYVSLSNFTGKQYTSLPYQCAFQ